MKKHKRIGNKGFSLIELIIVVAIVALLVVFLTPPLLRYVERTKVSADERLAGYVKTAFTAAMLKPDIMEDSEYEADLQTFRREGGASITEIGSNALGNTIAVTLGEVDGAAITDAWVEEQLSSKDATDIIIEVTEADNVRVTIRGSHADASGGDEEIVVE